MRLFVGGLPPDVTAADVAGRFSRFGAVGEAQFPPPKCGGGTKAGKGGDGGVQHRGFAYVDLEPHSPADVPRLLSAYSGAKWRGAVLKVELAKETWKEKLRKEWREAEVAEQEREERLAAEAAEVVGQEHTVVEPDPLSGVVACGSHVREFPPQDVVPAWLEEMERAANDKAERAAEAAAVAAISSEDEEDEMSDELEEGAEDEEEDDETEDEGTEDDGAEQDGDDEEAALAQERHVYSSALAELLGEAAPPPVAATLSGRKRQREAPVAPPAAAASSGRKRQREAPVRELLSKQLSSGGKQRKVGETKPAGVRSEEPVSVANDDGGSDDLVSERRSLLSSLDKWFGDD